MWKNKKVCPLFTLARNQTISRFSILIWTYFCEFIFDMYITFQKIYLFIKRITAFNRSVLLEHSNLAFKNMNMPNFDKLCQQHSSSNRTRILKSFFFGIRSTFWLLPWNFSIHSSIFCWSIVGPHRRAGPRAMIYIYIALPQMIQFVGWQFSVYSPKMTKNR